MFLYERCDVLCGLSTYYVYNSGYLLGFYLYGECTCLLLWMVWVSSNVYGVIKLFCLH